MNELDGVAPGVRELAGLTISKVSVGNIDNNCYLLRCRSSGEQVLIDAAAQPPTLLELCDRRLAGVVTTHRHRDHWERALAEVVEATDARTYAGEPDVEGIDVPTDVALTDGDVVRCGEAELRVIRLTGHTPGGIALLYDDPAGHPHLFTGDSLFPGGPGRTTNPTDFISLMTDLETKVFGRLPDDTRFYPGHGRDSTLGNERSAIPQWRARGW